MDYSVKPYDLGYSDGKRDILCALLCHGFDEKHLQKLFSIDDAELQLIVSDANQRIAAIKKATQPNAK